MREQFDGMRERFDHAVARAWELELPFPADAVDDVVIAGMGSSGDVGSMILGAFWDRVRKPLRASCAATGFQDGSGSGRW